MLDAYSIRKAVPRILIAAIGINLSIYLCMGAIEIVNVVGRGLGQLITEPFLREDTFGSIGVQFNAENNIAGTGLVLTAIAGVGGLVFAPSLVAGAGLALLGALVPFVITAALISLAILFTLVIRQGLLIFLVIVSPVAIALFVLPGTEKYFKKWWDLFIKTLLVYPIIVAMFAISTALAAILLGTAGDSPDGIGLAKLLAAIVVIFAPLVLIPFAFKLAGGAISAIMNVATGQSANLAGRASKKYQTMRQNPNSFIGNMEQNRRNMLTNQRSILASSLKDSSSKDGISNRRKRLYRGAGKLVGGTNIEAIASQQRAETSKVLSDQIATGRDEEIRALTVNRTTADEDWARSQAAGTITTDSKGNRISADGLRRVNSDNIVQYKTLGGAWVSDADVSAAYGRWGSNAYAQQAALSYEMRKAATDEQVAGIGERYQTLAMGQGGWNMDQGTAVGTLKGAGFENQNQHLEFKHMNLDGSLNETAFATELYEKKGSYQMSQMSAHTIKRLKDAYDTAEATGDADTKQKVQAIAETFMTRGGGRGVAGLQGEGKEATPIMQDQGVKGAAPEAFFQTNTPGAAHVAESVRDLAVHVGVYQKDLGSERTTSDPSLSDSGRKQPPPDLPRQN